MLTMWRSLKLRPSLFTWAERLSKNRRIRTSWFAISFIAATFTMFSLEYWTEHVIHGEKHPAVARSVFGMSSVYHTIVTAGYRKPQRRFTAIVTLDSKKDPAVPD